MELIKAEPVQAVIAVDLQRAFLEGAEAVDAAKVLVARAESLMDRARSAGAHVVVVQNDGPSGEPDEPGTPGHELAVQVAASDHLVRKSVDDAFLETDLETFLHDREVCRVGVIGLFSEMCVAATVRGAMERGFDVVLPHDGHVASTVPSWGGVAPEVDEACCRRVAEWSLGLGVDLVPSTTDVEFGPGGDGKAHAPSPGAERLR